MQSLGVDAVMFIRLGRKGEWTEDCVKRGVLRLGYGGGSTHAASLDGDWDVVLQHWLEQRNDAGAAARDLAQIRAFYESGIETLFITFLDDVLYWSRPLGQVRLEDDGTHERDTVAGWRDSSIGGLRLTLERLPDEVVQVRKFLGTICAVKARKQVLNLILDRPV